MREKQVDSETALMLASDCWPVKIRRHYSIILLVYYIAAERKEYKSQLNRVQMLIL